MTRNNQSRFDEIFDQLAGDLNRYGVGFDRVLDGFRSMAGNYDSYPPYNVEQLSADQYRVTLALAGFSKKDIDVTKEGSWLTISGQLKQEDDDAAVVQYLHRGIATRSFVRKVQLAEDIDVTGAIMENGLLYIDLVRIVPEEKKAKTIKIK